MLTHLYALNLSHNNISRIDGLLNSHSLGELNLSNNNISDISGLPSLINLKVFNVSNNKVSAVFLIGEQIFVYTKMKAMT